MGVRKYLEFLNKRNIIDSELLKKYNESKVDAFDADVIRGRIENNIELWENTMTKYKGLKYNQSISNFIKNSKNIRILIKRKTPIQNEKMAYLFCKHLINTGISPSEIVITNIDDCYLHYRGIGEESLKIKNNIFNDNVKVILIENMRDISQTDITDNVKFFWSDIFNRLIKNNNLNIILSFIQCDSNKWYPSNEKNKLKLINFKEI